MASDVARRLIGEAGGTPPHSSVASQWFAELGDAAQAVLTSGSVDNLELQATALLVPDIRTGDEYTERVATWEEAQADIEGNWTVVQGNLPVTAYSLYAHRNGKGAEHIQDFKSHEEAMIEANAIAALLGVEVHDLSPEFVQVSEAWSTQEIDAMVNKALKPYLIIKFLDGDQEEIYIKLEWTKQAYTTGSSWHPGLVPVPTNQQLRQIGGLIGKTLGGQFAMEVIYNHRYEGSESSGVLHDDPEAMAQAAEDTPDLYCRPLKWEYRNEGEPPESLYA